MSNNVSDIARIIDYFTGGGSSTVLLPGDFPITIMTSSYLKKGNMNNTLLAQTITLNLYLHSDSPLANFVFKAGKLTIAAPQGGCGSKMPKPRSCCFEIYTPAINEYKYIVVDLLPNKTVKGLFNIANKELEGGTLPAGVTLSNLESAVDIISNAFDGFRTSMGYNQKLLTCVEDGAAFDVNLVPSHINPNITYKFSYASNVTKEVWNISGIKLHTQCYTNSYLNKLVFINPPFTSLGTYIIKINTEIGSSSRTVIKN